ncbi:MAG: outer membrane beta-barrel protein [Prevotella sp.]|nr:outer membrane beta-barrel protein [Prevotella sp.]
MRFFRLGGLFVCLLGLSFDAVPVFSQLVSASSDSVSAKHAIEEVVITSVVGTNKKAIGKGRVASIDEHLQQLSKVNMVRRGTYAWEPVVNNMSTERVSTTIDGMKIFYACTDKMDPVTSYVESSNLQRISLSSGLDGNPQATGNIGGSIDLKLRRIGFDVRPSEYNASVGYESNGRVQAYGLDAAFSSHRFYSNLGVFYRHADNYEAGRGVRVAYSQFQKTNAFVNVGWQPKDNHIVEATVIYDIATDVGYPALNMDVEKAEGFISSLSYRLERINELFDGWETKLYFNRIIHNMDDTHRPDALIHMDMPGKSRTAGLYSLLHGGRGKHRFQLNYDAYYNTLFADMTMFPPEGQPMYMLTWPDVGTFNTGLALTDDVTLAPHHSMRISAKGAWQSQQIRNDEGFQALSIYFPGMGRKHSALIGRIAASYAWQNGGWKAAVGTGFGNRAPTVTEAFGYFLNNTFDRYDYIGNPNLKSESAVEANISLGWRSSSVSLQAEANAFFFQNYIVGRPDSRLSAMTIGAAGVKIYQNLSHAQILNAAFQADWQPLRWLQWNNRFAFSYGKESTGTRLPLIAPLSYSGTLKGSWGRIEAEGGLQLTAPHDQYSSAYGETPVSGYAVWHLNAGWSFDWSEATVSLHAGVENLFDHEYSTYSDWNHIPQKGRNMFVNATLTF